MIHYFCFEHVSRPSQHTPEWCTLRFTGDADYGKIEIKSRDKVRATRVVWDAIGTFEVMSGKRFIWLDERSFATRLAATVMTRMWNATVYMGSANTLLRRDLDLFCDTNEFDSVAYHATNSRISNPNTIRNGGTQVRRTSLGLGLVSAHGATHGNTRR